jgi:hypothetical protein
MRIRQDARFRSEAKRYTLRFTCESCALWDEREDRCAIGFPTLEHRAARYDDRDAPVVFCKDFDLL